jgi:hypothetical protein
MKGTLEMRGNIARAARRVPEAAQESLLAHSEEVLLDAQENYVPVDLGELRDSGAVSVTKRLKVTISFGSGPSGAYAAAVHEHPSEFSPPSWAQADVKFKPDGHGPKYLERPLMKAVDTLPYDLADDLHLEHLLE